MENEGALVALVTQEEGGRSSNLGKLDFLQSLLQGKETTPRPSTKPYRSDCPPQTQSLGLEPSLTHIRLGQRKRPQYAYLKKNSEPSE
ncbi:hypothetical protein SLEP1_g43519 [Rubroshorea leprosula]|uniref:Uncharacterized protein n=1 Tax=Rubroshorea leprosula TaxID=152421 RepID=A0AAV5LET4_9ROSI|nr:hypothetical protein SLEP1_g43519 [Rubroshorea leprosula]